MIDKIFIINLKHRSDRRKKIINELNNQNIDPSHYEFFDGIRPTIDDIQLWNENFCKHVIQDVVQKKRDKYLKHLIT